MVFSCERLLTSIKPLYFRNRLTPKTSLITEGVLLAVCGIYNIYEIVAPYFCLVNYPKDTDSENCNRLHPWLMTWGYLQIQIKVLISINTTAICGACTKKLTEISEND